jgi:hypothetical protein
MLFSMPPSWSSLITFTSGGISRMMFGLFCKPNIDEQSPDPGLRESGTSLRHSLESTRILSPIWNAFYQAAVDSEVRVQDPRTPVRERALSHLYLAEVLDLSGNRQQAITNYQQVLSAANVEDSHNTAQVYLKKPHGRSK